MLKRMMSLGAVVALSLILAACDSAEKRAEKHFEKALALLEEGDIDRALVEFRNVFKLNETHTGAQLAYAEAQERRGHFEEAYAQYLRLIEQDPEHLASRRALARLATELRDWDEAARHLAIAERLAPSDPLLLSLRVGLDYRSALLAENRTETAASVDRAGALLASDPTLTIARQVLIDDLIRNRDWNAALTAIDNGLEQADNFELFRQRLGVLEELGRESDVIAQLEDMVARYPDQGLHRVLIARHISQGRVNAAEAYLRYRLENAGTADVHDTTTDLIAFLRTYVGPSAAIEEIDRLLQDPPLEPRLLQAARAELAFETGKHSAAITGMQKILQSADPSDRTSSIKVTLAEMHFVTGAIDSAKTLVEEVLADDPGQIDALKIKAEWLIEEDRPAEAIIQLRTALDFAPRDADTMSLMAAAYERAGDADLMGNMLSLAAEASLFSPEESLRYARYLLGSDKLLAAEEVLLSALRMRPGHLYLLASLGDLYVRKEDWARSAHVISTLEKQEGDTAQNFAHELTVRNLAARNRAQELEDFLLGLAEDGATLRTAPAIIRLRLTEGDAAGAVRYANDLLAKDPDNPTLKYLRAASLIESGQLDEAITTLEGILADIPEAEAVWLTLYKLHRRHGDTDAASSVLARSLEALPASTKLNWAAAGEAEEQGDVDRAIAIYKDLYSADSTSVVIANNLASLLANYHSDRVSLERAFAIARRLRGTEVPQFQDTYGWISHQLGNDAEALEYLEDAAGTLVSDPEVQYHLAEVYLSLGQMKKALHQYRIASELLRDEQRSRPFTENLEAQLERLKMELN